MTQPTHRFREALNGSFQAVKRHGSGLTTPMIEAGTFLIAGKFDLASVNRRDRQTPQMFK